MSIWQHPNVQVECLFQDKLKRAKSGDDDAIAYLYDHFHKYVLGYIYNRTKDLHLAEDLTSDVFEKMVGSIRKIRANNEVGFRAWLLKVADRTIAQHFAHEKIKCVPLDTALEYPCVTEKYSAVTEAFNKLTEEQKQAIDGVVILGHGAEEVGIMMGGKKASTVRRLRFRGVNAMRGILIAATLVILFFLGITVKFVYDASPGSPLYPIKSSIKWLGGYIANPQQDEKPRVKPVPRIRTVAPRAQPTSTPVATPDATSTPISTEDNIVQPSPTAVPVTPTATPIACVVNVAGICL